MPREARFDYAATAGVWVGIYEGLGGIVSVFTPSARKRSASLAGLKVHVKGCRHAEAVGVDGLAVDDVIAERDEE